MLGSDSNTFKIFVGKIAETTSAQDIRSLFERYGKVVECDVVKNYGFVHMENSSAGYEAIKNLNRSVVNGVAITVEEAKSKKRSSLTTTKIFVSNVASSVSANDIRALFSKFGSVVECDLVRNYCFVHIDTPNLTAVLKELNGYEIGGQPLKVQISTSLIRQRPGMGNPQQCYKCGLSGHWSKECGQSSQQNSAQSSNQFQFMTGSLHGAITRPSNCRDFYQPPSQSSTFMRDRQLNGYSVPPDMRLNEYYDHYCQNALEQYEDYTLMASRRDIYGNTTRPTSTATDYAIFSRRSSNTSIAQYTTTNGNFSEYGGAVSYSYSSDPYYGCGNYSSTTATVSSTPAVTTASPYVDGRSYESFVPETIRNGNFSEERRSERRDGTSRSSSRYTPY